MRLSILIPAYQEASTIREIVDRVLAVDLESYDWEKEIVVCDDGSSDGTAEIVGEMASQDDRLKLVRHPENRGKGAAIRTALAAATGEYVLIQDADLEYAPEDYPRLLEPTKAGCEVVYGSRFLTRRRPTGMALPNFIANRILTAAANLLFDTGITDEATCFKVFRTELLRSLELECTGFEFCPEVTAKVGRRRIPIAEVPIEYAARDLDEGKKVRWTDGIEAMWVLIKHRFTAP